MARASLGVIGFKVKRNVGFLGVYAARESVTGTTGAGSSAEAIRTSSSLTSTSNPPAMLSSTLDEGSFSPRSISARYETETCAPSATCFNVNPRSLRSARRVSPMVERRSPACRSGLISKVFPPSAFRRQAVAGYESVGRVHADPHPAAPRDLPEIREPRAELRTGPDGVLDHRFGQNYCASVEAGGPLPGTPQAFHEPLHALLLAVSPVTASVHDDQVDPQRACGGQLVGQGQHRKFPLLLARGGKVYKVLRMCDDRRDAQFAASLDEGIGVLASPGLTPGLRVGDEDLDSLASELARGPKGPGEPAGGRKVPSYPVRPLWHGEDSTVLRRPSPGAI